jgi:PDZ domain-containing secreted protein
VAGKVRAAEAAGADVFLAPTENAAEAAAAARSARVVPVATFEDALNALRQLGSASGDARLNT